MALIHDRFQVPTDPAVITPFEDVDDPLADADVAVPSIERDDSSYYIFGPPSQSSDGRYTTRTRSSIGGGGGRGRRFSNHTQLTEPSSISDMPSDCFPLEKQKRSIAKAAMPYQTTTTTAAAAMAMPRTSSPAISPTTTHRDITAYRNGVASKPKSHHHSSRPRHPRRNHHTTAIDTPTRFHPEPTPTYSPYHSSTPSHSRSPSSSHTRAPLILLHVTLLPSPALPYPPHLLRRVLPRATMRAYAQLEERLADPVLMTRGLLVAHPREEMDVLEERVLEGLELRAPRVLKCGHFYHVDDDDDHATDDDEKEKQGRRRDSGVEGDCGGVELEDAEAAAAAAAAVQTEPTTTTTTTDAAPATEAEEDDEEEEITCTECHAHLPLPPASATNPSTRWTIKIYAANGLLAGPGAWSAAWSEMERVDVAITPYLSPAQHRALQAAVREEEQAVADAAAREAEERDALVRAAEEAGRREAEAEAEARVEEVRREVEGRLEGVRVEAEERLEAERMEAEERRKEAEERLEAERMEAETRLEAERVEAEERLEEEKQERLRLIGSAALAAAAERRAAEERMEEAKVQAVREERKRVREERARRCAEAERARREVPLATLVRRALWVAAVDWRNVLIVVLGVWLWMVGSGAVVPQSMGTELEIGSGVFFDAAMSPFFDNATVEQQFEVVRTTETVTATATATQTSTAIVTAFILETLAPQALEQSASTTTADLSEPTDTPDAIGEEYKDAVFAATTEILASAFEKMDAIIAALVDAYEKTADDEVASDEAQLPRTDVCSTFPELAYPTCAVDEEEFDVEQVEEDPRPRTCANRELEVEYFNRAAPTCSVHLVWV